MIASLVKPEFAKAAQFCSRPRTSGLSGSRGKHALFGTGYW
jgi:hypothetical protein